MSRIRTIKPEFWQHPKTAMVDRESRLLFIGLLNESDDEGRMRYSAKRLAGVLYPFDDDVTPTMVDGWVWQLERAELAERYEVEGAFYLAIPGFTEHQRISHAKESTLPEKPRGTCAERARNDAGSVADDVYREGEGNGMEQGGGTADAALPLDVPELIRAHRWANNVTNEEVNEAIFVLRQERIPDCILIEALAGAEAFPSIWKSCARKLQAERPSVRGVSVSVQEIENCEQCNEQGLMLDKHGDVFFNQQNEAVRCEHRTASGLKLLPPSEATA